MKQRFFKLALPVLACCLFLAQANAGQPTPDTLIWDAGSNAFILDIADYVDSGGNPLDGLSQQNAVVNSPNFRSTWMRRDYPTTGGVPDPLVDFLDGNTAAWTEGPLPAGYGTIDAYTNGNWSTAGFATDLDANQLQPRPAEHFGIYVRVPFNTTRIYSRVVMEFAGDDAFAFYLDDEPKGTFGGCCEDINGTPVGININGEFPQHSDFNIGGATQEVDPNRILIPGALLSGAHLLAVSVHQDAITSSDVGFDFRLVEPGNAREWNVDNHGDWNDPANWDLDTAGTGEFAVFGAPNGGNHTVWNDTGTSLDGIQFDDIDAYNIAGTGTLTLQGAGRDASLNALQGNHQFQIRVALGNNTESEVAVDSSITFNNRLSLNSRTLTKTGAGNLVIRNTANSGDGTIAVMDGAVAGNGTIAGSVNATATGQISPGAASALPTTLTVTGSASGNATFRLFDGDNDVLDGANAGTATISTATIAFDAGFTPANGSTFQLLQNWPSVSVTSLSIEGGLGGNIDSTGLLTIGTGPACDLDGNSLCDVDDLNQLIGGIVDGTAAGDMDGDGDTEIDDRDMWLDQAATENGFTEPYLLGDADLSGNVDANDLNRVGINWQNTATRTWFDGNFDGVGGTVVADLNVLGVNWLRSIPVAADTAAVPEPSALALLGLAGLCLLRRRN